MGGLTAPCVPGCADGPLPGRRVGTCSLLQKLLRRSMGNSLGCLSILCCVSAQVGHSISLLAGRLALKKQAGFSWSIFCYADVQFSASVASTARTGPARPVMICSSGSEKHAKVMLGNLYSIYGQKAGHACLGLLKGGAALPQHQEGLSDRQQQASWPEPSLHWALHLAPNGADCL